MQKYTNKRGQVRFRPSLDELSEMEESNEGFCICCGNIQDGCEPDARNYECDECGRKAVYGYGELALAGHYHT